MGNEGVTIWITNSKIHFLFVLISLVTLSVTIFTTPCNLNIMQKQKKLLADEEKRHECPHKLNSRNDIQSVHS
jgi:hypothetical protein